MIDRTCAKCAKSMPLSNFYAKKERNGNIGYRSYCKACWVKYNRKYFVEYETTHQEEIKNRFKDTPWEKHYKCIKSRCAVYGTYYKKGIKLLMTKDDFKNIWFRDKAWLLKRPSVDRINNKGHYELSNCRFIELVDNIKKGAK